jgi:hypothetical protein
VVWTNDTLFEVDAAREMLTLEAVPLYGYGELPDSSTNSPPVVTIVSPPVGSTIARSATITFDITDDSGGVFAVARVEIRTGGSTAPWYVVWKNGAFCAGFSGTRTAITNGFRYAITCDAGWLPGGVELEPVFADAFGGVNP